MNNIALGNFKLKSSPTVYNFPYTGSVLTITLGKGMYKLEVWGAEGGYRSSQSYSGKGGYSAGIITLTDDSTTLYVYAGGSGRSGTVTSSIYKGGFNGGGYRYGYFGGGGGSDIRIGTDSLYARVIVAGGGGSDGSASRTGMYGGGESGGSSSQNYTAHSNYCGKGGTATYSGYSSSYTITTQATTGLDSDSTSYYCGGFGFGGGGVYLNSGYGGAGGGGWYGGSGTVPDGSSDDDRGGGGGSGYIYTSSTASNYPSGCLLTSEYYLTDAITVAGNNLITSPTGTSETGHTGDGYARITELKSNDKNLIVGKTYVRKIYCGHIKIYPYTATLTLDLSSNQSNTNDLLGTNIIYTNSYNSYTYEWEGIPITIEENCGESYTISYSSINLYKTPTTKEGKIWLNSTIIGEYLTTFVTIKMSDNLSNYNEINQATATFTWESNSITVSNGDIILVPTGTNCTINWSDVEWYKTPSSSTFTASGSTMTKTGTYYSELLNITTTGASGVITVTGDKVRTITEGSVYMIPYGYSYTITASSVDGYKTPEPITRTASSSTYNVTITYVIKPIIKIMDTNGNLHEISTWTGGSNATGISVETPESSFVIAPKAWYAWDISPDDSFSDGGAGEMWNGNKYSLWGPSNYDFLTLMYEEFEISCPKYSSWTVAQRDYTSGKSGTLSMYNDLANAYCYSNNLYGSAAAKYCLAYSNGCKGAGEWYLPSAGLGKIIVENYEEINAGLSAISGMLLGTKITKFFHPIQVYNSYNKDYICTYTFYYRDGEWSYTYMSTFGGSAYVLPICDL